MEFKIDTKEAFTIITPLAEELNANIADMLGDKCEELRQSGSRNFIIDLKSCKTADMPAITSLMILHEECYGQESSLVITGLDNALMATIKSQEADLLLNVAPRLDEAIDIISMEILERDLLGEE